MTWLDRMPMTSLLIATVLLGLAPFVPEPHLWQKLKMLVDGSLTKPIDIFDLVMHGFPFILLVVKLSRMLLHRRTTAGNPTPSA